jgi:hypothetical protein
MTKVLDAISGWLTARFRPSHPAKGQGRLKRLTAGAIQQVIRQAYWLE